MNSYDKFRINLFVENLDEDDFEELSKLVEEDYVNSLTEEQLDEFKTILKKSVTRKGNGIGGKVFKHKKKDVSGSKSLKSDGKGGVTTNKAIDRAKRSRISKRTQRLMTPSKRKKAGLKAKFTKKKSGVKV